MQKFEVGQRVRIISHGTIKFQFGMELWVALDQDAIDRENERTRYRLIDAEQCEPLPEDAA